MTCKGEAGKALGLGIVSSFFGTLIGVTILVLVSPLLARLALQFGAYEYCALALFSLTMVISLTGKDMVKGLISAVFGALIATVGLAPVDSVARFTFGNFNLMEGFKLIAFLIGLFAIPEIVAFAKQSRNPVKFEIHEDLKMKGFGFSLKEFFGQGLNILRSAGVGIGVGILPGIGPATSNMMAYTAARSSSKHPEKFGTGIPDGVVAPETANSATIGGSMIPTLSLGVPGDGSMAILLGAFMVHDVVPGPLIFQRNGAVVYGIFISMVIASFVMLILMFGGIRLFTRLLKIQKQYLFPVILVFCGIGAIGDANSIFDMWGMFVFGLVSFGAAKAGIPVAPMILGFILGPLFETNLRRVSQRFIMDNFEFFTRPIAIVFVIVTIVVVILSVRKSLIAQKAAIAKVVSE
jgi:putative tricarboxylic transport membrane protein